MPLDAFPLAVSVTISVMVVRLLLGAGMLALEREQHGFGRLVRPLVARHGLVVERMVLAGLCAVAVGGIMLGVVATFVDLDWARGPLWVAAVAGIGLAIPLAGPLAHLVGLTAFAVLGRVALRRFA